MSKINQYENEEKLALREKNWNQRFVLGKIPNFNAYNDINYLSLGLLKSKLRYQERIKKEEAKTKSKYNERLYSANNIKSKSHAKPKFENNFKYNLKKEKAPSTRIYLNSNKEIKTKSDKKNSVKNVYNFPYQGTLTSYNVAGSNLFKYTPDYKDKNKNHNYIDYICEEDEEISDEYYLLKDLWEKLGVTENYINNFRYILNTKYKNRDELLEMLKGERKQMKQFRIEFMKVLSETHKRENKIKDLKNFIKIYQEILKKDKRYKSIEDPRLRDIEEANKEKIEGDIHDCLKSLRLKTINTVNAIQKFKKNYDHLFNNKIEIEILTEKYGYNEYYLIKLKNDLDFLRDSAINHLYHFSENGGDPFLLCISDLCGNIKDIKKYKQVRISEEVLSVAKKYMFFLEQEDVFNMTRKKMENNNIMKNYNSLNNYSDRNVFSQNYINNDYLYKEKRIFNNSSNKYKQNKKNINENLLSKNFKGNLEKEKLRLKAQNEYQNLFFNTEENYGLNTPEKKYRKGNKNINNSKNDINNQNEIPYKTLPTEEKKYHIKGMTSNQLFRHLERYGKIQNELFPATNKDKLKEQVKKNIVKNIEDRMKKVEIEFRLKMEEKFKKEEKKIKDEEKRIKTEKEKIEKLCKEEEEERKKKEEKYLKLEKEIEERKKKDKKINEENEKFEKREKDIFVKEVEKKLLNEVDERFKKEDEKQILFKKEMIQKAEKREKERKDETERIRHEEFEKIKRSEVLVDLREKKKKIKKPKKKKKKIKKLEESSEEEKKKDEDEEDDEEEEEEEEEEESEEEENPKEETSNKKNKNNNNFTDEKDDGTSDNINNNKKEKNQKESSNSNENISEDIELES